MKWKEFAKEAPELASKAEELFELTGVLLVGTLRKDGSPRISPVEPLFSSGELYLGMMWRSLKALDLKRDPRCALHNSITDRLATDGEVKVYGLVREVTGLAERSRFCAAVKEKIGWSPEEPEFHCFAIDVRGAALFRNESQHRHVTRWRQGKGVDEFVQGAQPDE